MNNAPKDDLSDIWEDGPPVARQPQAPRRRNIKSGPRPRRPPHRRWLSVAGYGGLTLLCLCLAAVAFVVIAAPVDLVRDRVVEQVKARTGRELVVGGPTALSVLPRPAISFNDVSLVASKDPGSPQPVVIPTVDIELRPWSLLRGHLEVQRITLHRPTIELGPDTLSHRGREGRTNQGRAPPDADGSSAAGRRNVQSLAAEKAALALARFGSGTIQVIDGTVRYRDQGTTTTSKIESVNLTLSVGDRAEQVKADGTLTIRGAAFAIESTVMPMAVLMAGQPAQLGLKISGPLFQGSYSGALLLGDTVSLEGELKLQAASMQALGDWLGKPSLAKEGADAVALSTKLKAAQGRVELSEFQANIGPETMAGSIALDTQSKRLRVSGNLQMSELDFGKLLVKQQRNQAAPDSSALSVTAPSLSVRGGRNGRDRGWSDDTVDISALNLLDANLALSAGSLIYKEVRTGPSRLRVAVENGVAKVALEDIELYDGRGNGLLTLDGTGDTLVAAANLNLNGVALRPILADALQFPWLEGRGKVSLTLAGQGLSERQIVETLNGKVDIVSADGAIVGLDVGKVVEGLQHGRLPAFAPSPNEKTAYSELAGTFTVVNGVAKNENLRLVGTHLKLNGEGTLDLGPRQIDYTVRTKIGGGAPAPDATIKVGTLEVPISIVGPWEKPTFGIKGQEQLSGALRQIRKNLRSQDVKDAIKGLLQGDGEKRVKPRDLVDKLLKKD